MSDKTALVVVHGVADQLPGATARTVVDLLVASSSATAGYRSVASQDLTLAVAPLDPWIDPPRTVAPTPHAADRTFFKSFVQSYRSDFQRQRWEAPSAPKELNELNELNELKKGDPPADDTTATAAKELAGNDGKPDRGLAFTDYLLRKHRDNGGLTEAYATTRIELERRAGAKTAQVDVYEMYWADLSRLSGAIPRILTEFGTLIFRLSRLGRDTVDEGRGFLGSKGKPPPAWRALAFLQSALDWLFVNLLAQLFFHLLLFGVVLVVLGLAAVVAPEQRLHLGVAIALAALGALLLLYRRGGAPASKLLPAAMLALAAVSTFVGGAAVAVTGVVVFAIVTAAYDAVLRVADERFPFVRAVGLVVWALLLAAVAWRRFDSLGGAGATLDAWRGAALYGTELTLWAIKCCWIGLAPLLVLWILAGLFAPGRDPERRASVATGRLGIGVSLCAFVVVTMTVWALLSSALDLSLRNVGYTAHIFLAPPPDPGQSTAQAYLQHRYVGSTETFAPVAILLLTLLVFAVVTLFPSVLAELSVIRNKDREALEGGAADAAAAKRATLRQRRFGTAALRLGRWLTAGYRAADVLMLLLCFFGMLISIFVLCVFAGVELPGWLRPHFNEWRLKLGELSQAWLGPFVIGAAGLVAALSLLGGLLSRYAPAVRAPLDVALDVDNYFREFPRRQIPRARIFARYVALLEHIAAQGYRRIVVVAHSQGTMISVETLRWLREGRNRDLPNPARERLIRQLEGDVRLLTAGCPLRQLYAARFPTLYRWVLEHKGAFCGPRAEDVGVRQWLNAFTSGDYVGRWLWTRDGATGDVLGHPLAEVLRPGALGRVSVYDAFSPTPPDGVALGAEKEAETCLGVGAHTHYFEPDQREVAWLIDYLIGSSGGGAMPARAGPEPADAGTKPAEAPAVPTP